MEVHAHTHPPRKKWIHYFWDFLMLFLAVTLGFFVENTREHYIERERAKQLAKSLYEDLMTDTSSFNDISNTRSHILRSIDTLLFELDKYPAPGSIPKIYVQVYKIIFKIHFKRTDGTINQLKNSGYLRYFSNSELPKKLMEYDGMVNYISEFEATYDNDLDVFVFFTMEHLDAGIANDSWGTLMHRKPIPANAPLYNMDKKNLNYFKYIAVSLKHLNEVTLNSFVKPANKKAIELMEIIKKEFHIKE